MLVCITQTFSQDPKLLPKRERAVPCQLPSTRDQVVHTDTPHLRELLLPSKRRSMLLIKSSQRESRGLLPPPPPRSHQVSTISLCVMTSNICQPLLIRFLLGLYAPREGQAYRERQRRQLSQFDRGTPGAENESAIFPSRTTSTIPRSTVNMLDLNTTNNTRTPHLGGLGSVHIAIDGYKAMGPNISFRPVSTYTTDLARSFSNLGI